jgi:hypothetical protein
MSKFGLYIAIAGANPDVPIQPATSKGALDAHLAIAQAPSETLGANCASRDSQ